MLLSSFEPAAVAQVGGQVLKHKSWGQVLKSYFSGLAVGHNRGDPRVASAPVKATLLVCAGRACPARMSSRDPYSFLERASERAIRSSLKMVVNSLFLLIQRLRFMMAWVSEPR